MTNSSKKKKERKQDFQKQKLKVGKARPKNTNATDTSFAAKCTYLLLPRMVCTWVLMHDSDRSQATESERNQP